MKKLMIAVAIVCAAAFSQAACVDWVVYGGAADIGADLYLVNASSLAGKTLSALTEADVTGNALTWYTGAEFADANPMKDYYSVAAANTYATANDANLSSSIYAILVKDGAYSIMNSGAAVDVSAAIYQPGESAKVGPSLNEMSVTHSYTTFASDVPEPTSGLLLLLGVAGLALKRKRA